MSNRLDIPFNITLLNLTDDKVRGIKPIRSLDIFDGKQNFAEDGLFSVSIFGKTGDVNRSRRFSYIDIKVPIFHPIIYNALVSLKRMYAEIMNGGAYVLWNDETFDFDRSDPINGKTGYAYFVKYWEQIKFKETSSVERQQNILLIEKYKKQAMLDRIVVMPAGLRDIEIDNSGRVKKDEINNYYSKLLSVANTVAPDAIKTNPEVANFSRNSLGYTYNELYENISQMIKGKKKLLLAKWASRRVFNGTRNVITAMDTSVAYLGAPGSVGFNDTLIGLYQTIKSVLPVARYQIRNTFIPKVFTSMGAPARLVDKQTRKMVMVNLPNKYYDYWMTDEGMEKIISSFSDEDLRNKPIEIEGHYLGLIYKGPDNTFKIIQDIDDVPGTRSKLNVTPLTFCELVYISCYPVLSKYPGFITRYPITGVGSIYPSFLHVKTTIKSEVRRELNEMWEEMDDTHIAYEFPVSTSGYFNTMSPHSSKLKKLTADQHYRSH